MFIQDNNGYTASQIIQKLLGVRNRSPLQSLEYTNKPPNPRHFSLSRFNTSNSLSYLPFHTQAVPHNHNNSSSPSPFPFPHPFESSSPHARPSPPHNTFWQHCASSNYYPASSTPTADHGGVSCDTPSPILLVRRRSRPSARNGARIRTRRGFGRCGLGHRTSCCDGHRGRRDGWVGWDWDWTRKAVGYMGEVRQPHDATRRSCELRKSLQKVPQLSRLGRQ